MSGIECIGMGLVLLMVLIAAQQDGSGPVREGKNGPYQRLWYTTWRGEKRWRTIKHKQKEEAD